jgi:hypothetical protein
MEVKDAEWLGSDHKFELTAALKHVFRPGPEDVASAEDEPSQQGGLG